MLGEDWNRQHASYYLQFAQRYQELPIQRWQEIDPFWGNVHWGADWATDRVERIFGKSVQEMVGEKLEIEGLRDMPINFPELQDDLKLMRGLRAGACPLCLLASPTGHLALAMRRCSGRDRARRHR